MIYKTHRRDMKTLQTLDELRAARERHGLNVEGDRRRAKKSGQRMHGRTRLANESWSRALDAREATLQREAEARIEQLLQDAWSVASAAGDAAQLARLREAFEGNGLGYGPTETEARELVARTGSGIAPGSPA